MPEHEHGHHGPPDTSRGFEQSDLSIPGIARGVVVYFFFTGAVGVFVIVAMLLLGQFGPPKNERPDRIPSEPNPLLQNDVTARTDIWNLRTHENTLLHGTSYVDTAKGIVRIPVEKAIDKIAQGGPDALNLVPPSQQTNTPGTPPLAGTFQPIVGSVTPDIQSQARSIDVNSAGSSTVPSTSQPNVPGALNGTPPSASNPPVTKNPPEPRKPSIPKPPPLQGHLRLPGGAAGGQ